MARHHEAEFSMVPRSYDRVLRLWVLRLLVDMGGHKELIDERRFGDDQMAEYLGLARFSADKAFEAQAARVALRRKHAAAQLRPAAVPAGTRIAANLAWLRDFIGLTGTEAAILHFCVLQSQHQLLDKALEMVGALTLGATQTLFSKVLDLPLAEVAQALRPSGALAKTGLLTLDLKNKYVFRHKVEVLRGFADQLTLAHPDPFSMFVESFVEAPASLLGPGDFPHVAEDLGILAAYLRQALAGRCTGVNVLIHGVPGTGKTQFARMLAEQLDQKLFEIATEDGDGDPLRGEMRFRSYRLCQATLGRSDGHLVLFDEVEDVFRSSREESPRDGGNRSGIKGFVNATLDANPVPAFWVTNFLGGIDPAFVRRFDFVLELGYPPRSVRAKVLDDYLDGLPVDGGWKAAMAEHAQLSPAAVQRAAKVVHAVLADDAGLDAGRSLARVMGNALEAQGLSREAKGAVAPVTAYRPELLNTDCDLSGLKAGLAREGQGRLCFYGPPGTGKTAFGVHLAQALDRPLLVKRASDLQSKWLGETEANIAGMFAEAAADRAVLLLDEADSFLQDRRGAQRSWEISQVNEMLTQLEGFKGVFIASTNLMDTLDPASLRRFDLKVKFGFLQAGGAWTLFQDAAQALGVAADPGDRARLARLGTLTPGDFANVVRQARLRRITSSTQLLAQLQAECALKPAGSRRNIGF